MIQIIKENFKNLILSNNFISIYFTVMDAELVEEAAIHDRNVSARTAAWCYGLWQKC